MKKKMRSDEGMDVSGASSTPISSSQPASSEPHEESNTRKKMGSDDSMDLSGASSTQISSSQPSSTPTPSSQSAPQPGPVIRLRSKQALPVPDVGLARDRSRSPTRSLPVMVIGRDSLHAHFPTYDLADDIVDPFHERESPDPMTLQDATVEEIDKLCAKIQLDPQKVHEGIANELVSLLEFDAYDEVDENLVSDKSKIIPSTVVLKAKGDGVKARVCACDYAHNKRPDVFSPTPVESSISTLLARALFHDWDVVTGDLSTAFLHADLDKDEEIYIKPPKVVTAMRPGKVWKLKKALYGLRRAPALFTKFFASCLTSLGFRRLKSDQCYFVNDELGVEIVHHVDDPIFAGPSAAIKQVIEQLSAHVKLKIGNWLSKDQVMKHIGKEYLRVDGGILTRLPVEYYEDLLDDQGMQACKPVATPMVPRPRPSGPQESQTWEEHLPPERHQLYRRTVGKLRFAVRLRPDLSFCVKELSRDLSAPMGKSWSMMKRCLRYVNGTKDKTLVITKPIALNSLEILTDSDHGGCEVSRRSTSSAYVFLGGCLLHHHCRQQTVVATSSGEAEYYAMCSGCCEGLAIQSLWAELGVDMKLNLMSDSSAARSMSLRQGLGRMKHLEVKMLWLQDLTQRRDLTVNKIGTKDNCSDLGTKALAKDRHEQLAWMVGMRDLP